jgi:AraC-like DNA-binding protein
MLRISFERPERAVSHALALHEELSSGRPGWESAALDCFRLFLIECARSVLSLGVRLSCGKAGNPCESRLEELRHFLDDNYAGHFTLDELSSRAGLNRNYLCRVFKGYTGKSIFEYLEERRLQAALLSLRDTGDKIASIAFDCGFQDLSFFNRKFKAAIGLSPSEYRRRMGRVSGLS